MVQLIYWESRGCRPSQFLKQEGFPNRILLFPYEGWAKPASQTYWIIKVPWWTKKRCKIVEISGTKRKTGKGKLKDCGTGTSILEGKFKQTTDAPYFRMFLSTDVTNSDFNLGYSMTGYLEQAYAKHDPMELTHYAMIKRKGY